MFRFTADKPGAYTGTLKLADAHAAPTTAAGNLLTAGGKLANGLQYETEVQVLNTRRTRHGLRRRRAAHRECGRTHHLRGGRHQLPARPRARRGAAMRRTRESTRQLRAAAAKPYAELRAAHVADYQTLFRRVSLDLGSRRRWRPICRPTNAWSAIAMARRTRELEALFFQYGRYLLISSSRPGSLPANLQGLWNNSNNPPWRSDYHSNINIQMNYWPAEPTNLSECAMPFFDYVNSLRGVRTEATRQHYPNVRGWTVQTENNIFGAGSFKWNPPGSAWYAQHFWEHYAFTRDQELPAKDGLPGAQGSHSILGGPPGGARRTDALVTPDGWSPGAWPRGAGRHLRSGNCLGSFHQLHGGVVGPRTWMRITAQKVAQLREKLLKPKIGAWGQLQEWMEDRDDIRRRASPRIAPVRATSGAADLAGGRRRSWPTRPRFR